jgi:DNA-binding NtrC family response regulator
MDFNQDGNTSSSEPALPPFPWKESIEVVLARYERRLLDHALAHANGVKRRAAALLGISRYALERRLARVSRTLSNDPPPAAETPEKEQATTAAND